MKRIAVAAALLMLVSSTPLAANHTDPDIIYSAVPDAGRPRYLYPATDPTFGSTITRISANAGQSTTPVAGVWGSSGRHHYSKDQPWNADGTRFLMYNDNNAWMLLDGSTYAPIARNCSSWYDPRWHPDSAAIIIDANATKITKYRISNGVCDTVRTWTLPFANDYGIGSGEGNLSANGRYIVIGSSKLRKAVVVDLDTTVAGAPYGGARFGPTYTFPACSVTVGDRLRGCNFDNLTISPSGLFVIVNYDTSGATSDQGRTRVYDVNQTTLALTPHLMAASSPRCGQTGPWHGVNGWIETMGHFDVGYEADNTTEVLVGLSHCSVDTTIYSLVKVRLSNGATTELTCYNGGDACPAHISMRATERPGWAYVSFEEHTPSRPFSDELVAFALDGSGVERICHLHTDFTDCYLCEAQPCPSPDGSKVVFASAWNRHCAVPCVQCGSSLDPKAYVVAGW